MRALSWLRKKLSSLFEYPEGSYVEQVYYKYDQSDHFYVSGCMHDMKSWHKTSSGCVRCFECDLEQRPEWFEPPK